MLDSNKGELSQIWKKTMDLFVEKKDIDSVSFQSFYARSRLYDINQEFATVVVSTQIEKQVLQHELIDIQNILSSVVGYPVVCQLVLQKEIEMMEPAVVTQKRNEILFENKIKEEFNFDNFVVGKNNREAQAAAMAVCHYPGQFYNPLFIYGNSGLGKTHLIHSIANYVKEIRPEDKVLYIYSEDFVTLIIESMKNKTVEEVKQKICSYDYVMIDDIQRLRQSTSQEVFFNLYNKLVGDNKQIVITSDIHPTELKGIENRLISRFSQGLTVSVGSPEFETAKAILLKKIEGRRESEILIQDEVLDFLATRFSSDVRKLEGSLNELFFKAVLYNPEIIDLDFAKEVFKENPVVAVVENTLNAQRIKSVVCEYYGLSVGQLESKSRTKNIANARHIAVYLCRKHLHMPFVKIGFEFGNRDHSTIMSSYEKMVKLLKDNETFQQAVFQLETKLGIGN
ncbi:chromosomal replication initiator protein DnaA [Amedibacterium intestinale]|jgi:chromosomal replication initiator protein dnaA|uniref:chromosomal replication initiator protein DnaA n=1 Tax=Amedibacterium intestinale TaxID=2583452 RepID=UPI000E20ADD2|nr:chromosomal replication initiator protein DnaA [Amedibacterium intestinale]RHO31142.1 chromosomal replication initiator protein DnaA [Erysipelotrichaceae bacterium AM17-60]